MNPPLEKVSIFTRFLRREMKTYNAPL